LHHQDVIHRSNAGLGAECADNLRGIARFEQRADRGGGRNVGRIIVAIGGIHFAALQQIVERFAPIEPLQPDTRREVVRCPLPMGMGRRPAIDPIDILRRDAIKLAQHDAHPHRRRHLVVGKSEPLAFQIGETANTRIDMHVDVQMQPHGRLREKHGNRLPAQPLALLRPIPHDQKI